jgi:hypothetical protein
MARSYSRSVVSGLLRLKLYQRDTERGREHETELAYHARIIDDVGAGVV